MILQLSNRDGKPSGLPLDFEFKNMQDHINELGFLNDGYDYSQHLREMGKESASMIIVNIKPNLRRWGKVYQQRW